MSPTASVLKLPFPAFQVARYASIAGKITAETKTPAEPVGDIPESAPELPTDAHQLANIMTIDVVAAGDADDQMSALEAAANLISISEDMNTKLNATVDRHF